MVVKIQYAKDIISYKYDNDIMQVSECTVRGFIMTSANPEAGRETRSIGRKKDREARE